MADAFARAAQAAGQVIERDYQLGDCRVRLRFAGPALLPPLTPALAHVAARGPGQPDLTIGLWETEHTAVAPPPPPWDYEDFASNGLIRAFTTERFSTHYQLGTNALSLLDGERHQAFYWVKRAGQIPYWDTGAPLRVILSLWFNRRGCVVVHAGAVGLRQGGVLLAGAGGSGKSNTALAALPTPLGYAGDDFTLLSLDGQPTAYSLYCSGKVNAADLERLPFLTDSVVNHARLDQEKALAFLDREWPHKLLTRFAIRAVLLPHVTRQAEARLRPASAAEGVNALAPSTLDLSPAVEKAAFETLVELFRRVPCYHLDLGAEVAQPPRLILDWLNAHP